MISAVVYILFGCWLCSMTTVSTEGYFLPDEILPAKNQSRSKRAMSSDALKQLEGNWKLEKDEIKKLFDEYNQCITESNKPENRIHQPITAILAMEGQRVDLKCPFCKRPDQPDAIHTMFWQRVRISDSSTAHISPHAKGLTIKKDMALIIKV